MKEKCSMAYSVPFISLNWPIRSYQPNLVKYISTFTLLHCFLSELLRISITKVGCNSTTSKQIFETKCWGVTKLHASIRTQFIRMTRLKSLLRIMLRLLYSKHFF